MALFFGRTGFVRILGAAGVAFIFDIVRFGRQFGRLFGRFVQRRMSGARFIQELIECALWIVGPADDSSRQIRR